MKKLLRKLVVLTVILGIISQCLIVSAVPWYNQTSLQDTLISYQWYLGATSDKYGATPMSAKADSPTSSIDINILEAWDMYNGGDREVIVAVIDTGIDYSHVELADAMWVNENESLNGIDDDGNGYVDDVYGWNFYDNNNNVYVGDEGSHGTHVAGIIAAAGYQGGTVGIVGSSTVKIMNLKIFGEDGTRCTPDMVADAIDYAEANGAVICNISIGMTQRSERLRQVVENSNMLIVVSAGNTADQHFADIDKFQNFPASYDSDSILAVSNVGQDGFLSETSNYGVSSVDIAAPGKSIISTAAGGGYSYMSGTSMAAPMVTAVAAMIYSEYESLSLQEVKQIILDSATEYSQLEGYVSTSGILNAGAAMKMAAELEAAKVITDTKLSGVLKKIQMNSFAK